MKKLTAIALMFLGMGTSSALALPTNKQLTIAIHEEFETLNPVIQQMAATAYIYYLVGRPLDAVNADWKWQCYACKEIPTVENGLVKLFEEKGQKKLRATWEIREGMKWGDGTPVTGQDFKFSWEVGNSPKVSTGSKDLYTQIESVTVDPKNPRKFVVTHKEARYDYYQMGTFYILPSHLERAVFEKTKNQEGAYEKQTNYATNPTNPGLYNGPYRISEIQLGSHVIMVPNEHFYGPKPAIQKIIFKLIPNTQTLEANLVSGTVDMSSELGMNFDEALSFDKRVQRNADLKSRFQVVFRRGTTYEHIDLNLRNPTLQDIRVRRALMYALDRQRLVQALFEGRQEVALHDIHPLDPYFTDDVMKYPHDPKKAAALLDEAGWKMGPDGFRMREGKKLSMTIMTTAENKTREMVQVFLQNEWKKVGIDVRIKNEPARVFFAETLKKGVFGDMAMYAWVASPDSPPFSTLLSTEIPTLANGFSGQNNAAFSNKRIDEALTRIKGEFDFNKRKELMKVVQQEYAHDVGILPLYMRAETSVIPTNMQGYRITAHQFYSTLAGEYWSLK